MIIKEAKRGQRVQGLVYYVFDERESTRTTHAHVDSRVVAAWDPTWVEAGRLTRAEQYQLAQELDAPRRLCGGQRRAKGDVMHVVLANDPTERALTDQEWQQVAADLVDELGIAEKATAGDDPGRAAAPWVAIRHADNHIHLMVVLTREDGHRIGENELWRSRMRSRRIAERWEDKLNLRRTGRGTGLPGYSRPEIERAHRTGTAPTSERLERLVRGGATQARNEAEFVDRLRHAGLAVFPNWEAGGRVQLKGYAVALPSKETGGRLVKYGGGRLAKDLTLPALRDRWEPPDPTQVTANLQAWRDAQAGGKRQWTPEQHQPEMWTHAASRLTDAAARLDAIAPHDVTGWADVASDTAGTLATLAARLEPAGVGPLSRAARSMSAAAQIPAQRTAQTGTPAPGTAPAAGTGSGTAQRPARSRSVPAYAGVARVAAGAMIASAGGRAAVLVLLAQLGRTIRAVQAAHEAGQRAQHAARAAASAAELNLAYRHIKEHGPLPAPERTPTGQAPTPPGQQPAQQPAQPPGPGQGGSTYHELARRHQRQATQPPPGQSGRQPGQRGGDDRGR